MLQWGHVPSVTSSLVAVWAAAVLGLSAPVQEEKNGWLSNPDENRGIHTKLTLFEGDIFIDEERYTVVTRKPFTERSIEEFDEIRSLESHKIWHNRTVPYTFDASFAISDQHQIKDAMENIENSSCIRFTPRVNQSDYVRFAQIENACYSQVGRSGGQQTVSLGWGCLHYGTVVHELLHVLGLWHEHSRPDRDAYITVITSNIAPEHQFNFEKRPVNNTHEELKGLDYDYGSVMHYSNTTFAKDRHSPTIVADQPLPPGVVMGQRVGLSKGDVDKINALYRCDISNCSTPAVPVHSDVTGTDFSVGVTVTYSCHQGHLLVGGATRECQDTGEWSGEEPVCISASRNNAARFCAFSVGDSPAMCGWTQDHTDDLDWSMHAGPTQSLGTGPDHDHTLMTHLGGYVYTEASSTHTHDTARLLSPALTMPDGPVCMVLYVHMHGSMMGNLTVYKAAPRTDGPRVAGAPRHALSSNSVVLSLQGEQGATWRQVMVMLGAQPTTFQITLEASLGDGYLSDIAVDDITLAYCRTLTPLVGRGGLQSSLFCTFDDGLCGLLQDQTEQLDWRINAGMTNTFNTGPDCDPNNCTHGHYLYLETSTPAHPGDTARLRTPVMGGSGTHCLTFLYHMYGAHMGSLAVTLTDLLTGSQVRLWEEFGNHGNQWFKQFVEFTVSGAYEITFVGTKGSGYRSDMSLDTVVLVSGACSGDLKFNCTFDRDSCGWHNETSLSNYKHWARHSGYTDTPNTGPDGDRLRPLDGSYMMVEASSSYPGDSAALISPVLTSHWGCLCFWYHQSGSTTGNLTVALKIGDSLTDLWACQGDQGTQWRTASINLTNTGGDTYQVVFVADLAGFGGYGDVAIDDVKLLPDPCTD